MRWGAARTGGGRPDPGRYGAVVALGSDRSSRLAGPFDRKRSASYARPDAGVPVLGLSFGGQALAAAWAPR